MSYLHTIVDRVYVINLEKDTERLKRVDTQLRTHYITYERFPAILGKTITHSRKLTEFCNIYCTDGMKGCALSHRSLWEGCVQKGYKAILVLEDDMILDPNFNELLQKQWQQVPPDFDIVYLGCNSSCELETTVSSSVIRTVMNNHPKRLNEHVLQHHGGIGTQGYIISNQCARRLLTLPISTHIDTQMLLWAKEYNLSVYSLVPKLVTVQNDSGGTNLSDTFPPLLSSALSRIPITEEASLGWGLTENSAKLFGWNISLLLVFSCLLLLVIPTQFAYLLFLWLAVEWFVSKDTTNATKYAVFFLATLLLKYIVGVKLYGFSGRIVKSTLRRSR